MLIFLYGRDTYRSKENLNKIIGEYHRKYSSGLNFHSFDFSESPSTGLGSAIAGFEDAVKSHSFFDEKKLVLLKNSFVKGVSKKVAEIIKSQGLQDNKDVVVIFYEKLSEEELGKADKELLRTVLNSAKPQKEFKPLTKAQLKKWLADYLKTHSLAIKPQALENLCQGGSDLLYQNNNLNKLAGFARAMGLAEITEKEINLLITSVSDINIFELLDSISAKQKARALFLIENFLKNGGEASYLFSMVAYQIRNLLIVKDLASRPLAPGIAVKKSGLHPFVYKKAAAACEKIDKQSLLNWHSKLLEWDIKVKSGIADIETVLLNIPLSFA